MLVKKRNKHEKLWQTLDKSSVFLILFITEVRRVLNMDSGDYSDL